MRNKKSSILSIFLLATIFCHWVSIVANGESKDKQDVGTVIGIDLGKLSLKFDIFNVLFKFI